ncbi:UNVERIFIED_CONTAM: hypothetical protein Sindi_2010100 [Sesamum indicum]
MTLITERSINDMTSPDLNQQPLSIEYPNLEVNFELKSITRWNDLKRQFLEKYFPASRATTIRKEISGIRQFAGESLFEYWERFNQLVGSSPHHQIPDHLLIQYFYEGLSSMDRKLIDAASGGALFHKTPIEARNLISIMASNTQQFGVRYDDPPRRSNEVSNLEDCLNQLTSIVEKVVEACGCTLAGHTTDMCPTLQESTTEHADAVGGFTGQQQKRYDPFSNTYNPGWRDHLNLSYDMMKALVTNTQQFQQQTQTSIQQFQQQTQTSIQQFQQQTQMSIQNLESQISQLASSVGKLESQGKLPSQSVINSRQNASAIVLRSGKELQENVNEDDTKRGHGVKRNRTRRGPSEAFGNQTTLPRKFTKAKKEEEEKEIFETFRKVEVNIPLLDAIKQIPRYAKFFKELCTSKGKLKENEWETGVVIQLVDRSVVYPEGVLEDVLVQVNELVFPADFYVLDMREDNSPNSTSILLGRPFLKTARTKIDVHSGSLTMEFDGEIIRFNIYESMRYPTDLPTAFLVDIFDHLMQDSTIINGEDHVKYTLEESLMLEKAKILEETMIIDPLVQEKAKFDGYKDFSSCSRTYKNKAFHNKISSRKNSLMNLKIFLDPHHLWVNDDEEEENLKCQTYSS